MKIEKHFEILKEVFEEIQNSLDDSRGIYFHQRRIVFMISLGTAELIEVYLHKLNVMKEGSRIKHEWLKRINAKEKISYQITKSIDLIPNIDEILGIAIKIENKRNDLVYSSPEKEEILIEQISDLIKIKDLIENQIGDLNI